MIPQEWVSERIIEKIVEVVQIITQEFVQKRSVKQIVEVVHSIPVEVENAQMKRTRGKSR